MTLPVLPHPVWTSKPPDFRPAYGEGVGCCRSAGPREWERTAFVHRSILSRSTLREMERCPQPSRDSPRTRSRSTWDGTTQSRNALHAISFFPPFSSHAEWFDEKISFRWNVRIDNCNCNWVVLKIGKIISGKFRLDIPWLFAGDFLFWEFFENFFLLSF